MGGKHDRTRQLRLVIVEQRGKRDSKRTRHTDQRRHGRVRPRALDVAPVRLGELRALRGHRLRQLATAPQRTDSLAELIQRARDIRIVSRG
jgi:hypothetical protein